MILEYSSQILYQSKGIVNKWQYNIYCFTLILALYSTRPVPISRLILYIYICRLLELATGPGNPPAFRVWTGKTVWFGSRTVQKPNRLLLGGPNPALYPSTGGFCRVWLDPSGPISGSVFRGFLFMVAFRYPTVNCKILTMVLHGHFLMYWQPLYSKQVERRSLPHPEN